MASKPIELVYAVARNGVIGRDNAMPWHLPSDLKRFKANTMGNPVVMGRRTHESIGRPLPGRLNIVVSRDPDYAPAGCAVAHSPDEAVAIAAAHTEGRAISVIGGAQIYRALMDRADRLIVTEVDATLEGDTTMPPVDTERWRETARERGEPSDGDTAPVSFVTYERR